MANTYIGTCSWKYNSWQGLVYPMQKPLNYLQEYSKTYKTVEVDQWFWSLFDSGAVVLPKPQVVDEYAGSVPDDFKFGVKVPNAVTLTHYYSKKNTDPLIVNPYFLSNEIMDRFLERLLPLSDNLGPLMFQFEYLNKQKMSGGLKQFIARVGEFVAHLPDGYHFGVEIRNPNFLKKEYFEFLDTCGLHHVFLHGYYMPSAFEIFRQFGHFISNITVIRLHGPDRVKIEKQTGKDWSRIVSPKEPDLLLLSDMLIKLHESKVESFVFVNNHFEGSAPRTIEKIMKRSGSLIYKRSDLI